MNLKKLVAVVACPAGIAHTYMAAEMLEKEAKKAGLEIKVETNGAAGVENKLSKKDIADADAVIVAADTAVEMERFRGKLLLEVSVSLAVRKANKVIEQVLGGEAVIY